MHPHRRSRAITSSPQSPPCVIISSPARSHRRRTRKPSITTPPSPQIHQRHLATFTTVTTSPPLPHHLLAAITVAQPLGLVSEPGYREQGRISRSGL
ncbi:hypothetical protein Tco_1200600 [Tanacetum coccineum]